MGIQKKGIGFFLFLSLLLGCKKGRELTGAGATFPYPFYSKAFYAYYQKYGVKVNYQSIGSGGGVKQILAKTVDFGASDAYMKDSSEDILHIPTCIGGVVIVYNLPIKDLKLDGNTLAEIFLGKIQRWNDKKIQDLNPGVSLPNQEIIVVHRSDGSGTTHIFTEYLSGVSKEWKEKVGTGKAVSWPVGVGGKGNEGVTALVKKTQGAIGYVEYTYAVENALAMASIKNPLGEWVKPSLESISLAGEIKDLPDDMRISLVLSKAKGSYPLSSFTWILVYKEQAYKNRPFEKAKDLVHLLWYLVHDAQELAKSLHYAPLPPLARKKAETLIQKIQYQGIPIWKKIPDLSM